MENKIKELIDKYKNELRLNEKLYTIVESSTLTKNIIEDLKSLLKLYQAQNKEIPTIHNTIYRIGEK